MRKNFKRIISVLMVAVMVIAMAAGCGKKEETAEADKEETKVEAPTEKEAEPVEDKKAEEETEAAADIYDYIRNSVKANYLEPKNIAASDFKWPAYEKNEGGTEIHDEGYLWTYFNTIFDNYWLSGNLFDTTDLPVEPSGDKDLMNAVLIGIDEWTKLPENEDIDLLELQVSLVPYYETIPANVTFTE